MVLFYALFLLLQHLSSVAATVYTGFAYGAFWTESKPKTYQDFLTQFNTAKNLPNVPVPFTSARLFQTAQFGTETNPSEAFQAAIETNTTLLLGLWLSTIENELDALDNAFKTHGQQLADLVVGISVGNEDIYRSTSTCSGKEGKQCPYASTKEQVLGNITNVRNRIQTKDWYKLFKQPPLIGHTDVAAEAALENTDFTGTTIYPIWHGDPIDKANDSFFQSLTDLQKKSGKTPVWITETGWPASGHADGASEASLTNMQQYWTKVGCSLFGKYNVWWFELGKDTEDAFDWGISDKKLDLSCPNAPSPGKSASPAPAPSSNVPSTFVTLPSLNPPKQSQTTPPASSESPKLSPSPPSPPPVSGTAVPPPPSTDAPEETIVVTQTVIVTVPAGGDAKQADATTAQSTCLVNASAPAGASNEAASGTVHVTATGCVTVADIFGNGLYAAVATNPPGPDGKCSSPSPYLASHYTPPPSGQTAPSDQTAAPASAAGVGTSWVTKATGCITVADVSGNGQYVSISSNPPGSDGECASPPPYTGMPKTPRAEQNTQGVQKRDPLRTGSFVPPVFPRSTPAAGPLSSSPNPSACQACPLFYPRAPLKSTSFVPPIPTDNRAIA